MFRIPAQARSSQLAVLCAAFFLENLFAISDYLVSLAGQIQSAASSIFWLRTQSLLNSILSRKLIRELDIAQVTLVSQIQSTDSFLSKLSN
jgi:hypothetical protein